MKKVPLTVVQNRKKPKRPVIGGGLPYITLRSVELCYLQGEDLARLGDNLDDMGTVRLEKCVKMVVIQKFKWDRSEHQVAPWVSPFMHVSQFPLS